MSCVPCLFVALWLTENPPIRHATVGVLRRLPDDLCCHRRTWWSTGRNPGSCTVTTSWSTISTNPGLLRSTPVRRATTAQRCAKSTCTQHVRRRSRSHLPRLRTAAWFIVAKTLGLFKSDILKSGRIRTCRGTYASSEPVKMPEMQDRDQVKVYLAVVLNHVDNSR